MFALQAALLSLLQSHSGFSCTIGVRGPNALVLAKLGVRLSPTSSKPIWARVLQASPDPAEVEWIWAQQTQARSVFNLDRCNLDQNAFLNKSTLVFGNAPRVTAKIMQCHRGTLINAD